MKHIFYFLSLSLLISCSEKKIVTKYDSGKKFEEYSFKGDSLKHGDYERFSEGGILLEKSFYQEGKLVGIRTIFDSNGTLEVEEFYENGILNGDFKEFYPSGKLKLQGNYNQNVLEGIVKGYYPSGNLKEEVYFVDNFEEGPFKEFHENGKLKWEGTYRNGSNEFGLLKNYNEKGELIKKMMCDERAICTTTWTIDGSHLKSKKESE